RRLPRGVLPSLSDGHTIGDGPALCKHGGGVFADGMGSAAHSLPARRQIDCTAPAPMIIPAARKGHPDKVPATGPTVPASSRLPNLRGIPNILNRTQPSHRIGSRRGIQISGGRPARWFDGEILRGGCRRDYAPPKTRLTPTGLDQ